MHTFNYIIYVILTIIITLIITIVITIVITTSQLTDSSPANLFLKLHKILSERRRLATPQCQTTHVSKVLNLAILITIIMIIMIVVIISYQYLSNTCSAGV